MKWENKFTKVTEKEFDDIVAGYPNSLMPSVCNTCSPPSFSYEDRGLGRWPRNVVAYRTDTPEFFVLTRLIKPVE